MNSRLTQYAFLSGSLYFCCMATAHFFSIKVPVLFVYYDVPFYAYQDKIISFAVTAYIALFYGASKHREVALYAIIVMAVTVMGLTAVNLSDTLHSTVNAGQSTLPYWVETGAIGVYLALLCFLYKRDSKNLNQENK